MPRAGNLKLPALDGFRSSMIFLSCILHDHLLPLQPLFPGFFLTVWASSSAAFLAFSSADCSSVLSCSIFFCSSVFGCSTFCCPSALTAPPLEPLQPLAACAAGSVMPPMLIKPATLKEASNFFRSFFSIVSSLENWVNGYRTNQSTFPQLSFFSIIRFQDRQQNGVIKTVRRPDENQAQRPERSRITQ
jgi:hypothetical protein